MKWPNSQLAIIFYSNSWFHTVGQQSRHAQTRNFFFSTLNFARENDLGFVAENGGREPVLSERLREQRGEEWEFLLKAKNRPKALKRRKRWGGFQLRGWESEKGEREKEERTHFLPCPSPHALRLMRWGERGERRMGQGGLWRKERVHVRGTTQR